MAVNNYRFGESVGYVLGDYTCEFIGSTLVQSPSGNDTCQAAIERIKRAKKPTKKAILVISPKGIAMLDAKTKKPDKVTPIGDVTFVCMDQKNNKIFSFISNNKALNIMTCYNYKCSTNSSGVVVDINDAFAISSKKVPHPPREGARVKMTQEEAAKLSRKQSMTKKPGSMMKRQGSRKSGTSTDSSDSQEGRVLGTFEAKYISSVPCTERKGEKTVLESIDDAFERSGGGGGDAFLMVSSEAIKCVNAVSQVVAWNLFLKEVSFTTVVNNLFAFITENEGTGRTVCHVFACAEGVALEICTSIGEAFKVAQAASKKAGNPFTVKGKDLKQRERATPKLQNWQIHRKDLTAEKAIGAGQFGQVWLGTKRTSVDSSMRIAVKLMRSGCSAADKEEFVRECEMTVSLNHKNLVGMIGVAIQQKPWLCVLEFLQYGDVKGVLEGIDEKGFKITEYERLNFCHQICSGMEHMASKKMIHMDLALRNVLIKNDSQCKVSDFGLTRLLDGEGGTFTLTGSMKLPLKWMSIEAMDRRVFSEESDVWAFGVVVWEIYTYGAMPYEGVKNADLQIAVRNREDPMRLEKPEIMPQDVFDLCSRMWGHARTDRPPFEVCLSDFKQWMTKSEDKNVRDLGKFQKEAKKPVKLVKKKMAKRGVRENFFAGDMPGPKAEAMVKAGPKGGFLVRQTSPGNFAICINDGGAIINFPVAQGPAGQGFKFADKVFRSMETIVNLLKSSPFKGATGPMTLSKSVLPQPAAGGGGGGGGGTPQRPAANSGPPAWYFGKTVPVPVCEASIKAGGDGAFLVRVAQDGDTAYILINDQGTIAEFPISQINAKKFIFAKREHKSLDEIVNNLKSNAIPNAKTGRKVRCLMPAKPVKGGGGGGGTPQRPAPAKAAASPAKKPSGPPAWYFGKTTPIPDCVHSIKSAKNGQFLVRVAQDGDSAYIMANDKGEIAEFAITQINAKKFIFAKREHKSLDEIVNNLKSNAIPSKSGRKVMLTTPATRVAAPKGGGGKDMGGRKKSASQTATEAANETMKRKKTAPDTSYFVGLADEDMAEKVLKKAANGSFLVRQIDNATFEMMISENKKVSKNKIEVNSKGKFEFAMHTGKDLTQLIELVKRDSVVSSVSGKPITLEQPCPGAAGLMPSKMARRDSVKSTYGFGDDGSEDEEGFGFGE